MAEQCSEESRKITDQPLFYLEKGLNELKLEIQEARDKLRQFFQNVHNLVSCREAELMSELDAIPANISLKLSEREASLEQLIQNKNSTERELQSNCLNDLLQKQLDNITAEMEKILSEEIRFPRVVPSLNKKIIQTALEEACIIRKPHNPYKFRTNPVCSGIDSELSDSELSPTGLCIDKKTQLIYVVEYPENGRIHRFTSEGKHHSTLCYPHLEQSTGIIVEPDFILVSTFHLKHCIFKLDMAGHILNQIELDSQFIMQTQEDKLFVCPKSFVVQEYNLSNFKLIQKRKFKAKSNDKDTFPRDLIIMGDKFLVLLSYKKYILKHPDPIQLFESDGTLIRSIVPGDHIKQAYNFCLDSQQNIIVSDWLANCIRVFTFGGILLQIIGREGWDAPGDLYKPRGIAVDAKGRIVVVDWKVNNRLQLF